MALEPPCGAEQSRSLLEARRLAWGVGTRAVGYRRLHVTKSLTVSRNPAGGRPAVQHQSTNRVKGCPRTGVTQTGDSEPGGGDQAEQETLAGRRSGLGV